MLSSSSFSDYLIWKLCIKQTFFRKKTNFSERNQRRTFWSRERKFWNLFLISMAKYPEEGYAEKTQATRIVYDDIENYTLVMASPDNEVAIATQEETERYNELYTDLETYFKELNLKLIMGEKSVDDMDTYIAEMQELGLDELVDIYLARYDRLK